MVRCLSPEVNERHGSITVLTVGGSSKRESIFVISKPTEETGVSVLGPLSHSEDTSELFVEAISELLRHMTKLDFDVICVYLGSAGQKFSDFTELGHIAAGFPIAANPVVCMDQMNFNKVISVGHFKSISLRRRGLFRRFKQFSIAIIKIPIYWIASLGGSDSRKSAIMSVVT
ncbi:hypothetical protein N7534_005663 [Penicillium rubens]|nr:hypothetical protein N7534_005663 [Penicillium rubens]